MADQGSPQWWTKVLWKQLQSRQDDMQLHRDLVDDNHAPAATSEQTAKYREMARLSTTNLCGLVVEATAERMRVEGFRFGDNPEADEDAWRIWQSSDFDSGSAEAITHALVYGRSFVSVDPFDRIGPRLICEDPRQVIIAYSSDGRRDRLAALKVWADEWTGTKMATLYLPGAIYRMQDNQTSSLASAPSLWGPREIVGQPVVAINPLGEVPFFELRNRIAGRTRSEIARLVIPQERLNQAVFNTDAVAEYGAFRQKWATGIDVPVDPITGQRVSPFNVNVAKMLVGTPPAGKEGIVEPKFGDFNATDLSGYLELGREIALHVARIGRIPTPYFLPFQNVSAEALALAVSGLVNKCRQRVLGYEPALEGAVRFAFKAMGDPRANEMMAETRWASMETRSVAQDADAAVKLTQGDNPVITPQTAQQKYLGMSDTEQQRDQAWRDQNGASGSLDALLSAAQAAPLPQ